MTCFIFAFLIYLILVIYYNVRKKNINDLIETEQSKLNETKNVIANYSEKYLKIKKLNNDTSYNYINSVIEIKANAISKKQFDNYDYDYLLNDYLNNNKQIFNELEIKVNHNKRIKNNYDKRYYEILNEPSRVKSNVDIYNRNYYLNLETKMLKELYLNIIDNVNYKVIVNYISPQGLNRLNKSQTFSIDYLKNRLDRIINITKEQKEYERSLLNDSLRYDVFKRDNFKCVICGASAKEDGVKLHVDHIIPISKGGKTVLSNLRTLCDRCNLGKSDKYDESGMN